MYFTLTIKVKSVRTQVNVTLKQNYYPVNITVFSVSFKRILICRLASKGQGSLAQKEFQFKCKWNSFVFKIIRNFPARLLSAWITGICHLLAKLHILLLQTDFPLGAKSKWNSFWIYEESGSEKIKFLCV